MAKRPSLNPFGLIGESWSFLRKQPALWSVLLWFMIVPAVAIEILDTYRPQSELPSVDRIGELGYVLATLLFLFVTFWGAACIQVVGRRMIQSKAGRARTSFKAVRRDAVPLIIPLFFTDLLRSLVTLEWALLYLVPSGLLLIGWNECHAAVPGLIEAILAYTGDSGPIADTIRAIPVHCFAFIYLLPLLIPAVVYQIRSIFFDAVIGTEGLRYRQALRRSAEVVRGKFWKTTFALVVLGIVLFVPASLIGVVATAVQGASLPQYPIIGPIVTDIVTPVGWLLFALSSIALFGKLRKLSPAHKEVKPRD
jgi:hypothetical protein